MKICKFEDKQFLPPDGFQHISELLPAAMDRLEERAKKPTD